MSKSNNRRRHGHGNEETGVTKVLRSMGFVIGKTIGEGTYSKVCLATATYGNHTEKVACKIINKKCAGSDFIKRFLPRELKIVRLIEHPNIVTVFNIIEISDTIYMFMDYCRNGDLLEYIRNNGPLAEDGARSCFRQLVNAVEYLHDLDIAHRDLKCENVLLTLNNSVKLGDFGFSRSCCDEETGAKVWSKTFCGSAAYAAPEILQGISYDPKMYDMWALGCILYIMLSASMPFDDSNVKLMLKSQLKRPLSLSILFTWKINNSSLKNLLSYLLEPDVKKRATIKQVVNCIWFQDSAFKKCIHLLLSMSDGSTLF